MEKLNPGIKKTVELLQSWGFSTTDSGDGKTHDFDCDRDCAYVSMIVEPKNLIWEADHLKKQLEKLGIKVSPIGTGNINIQASFDPANWIGILDLTGLHDELLPQ